MSDLAELVDDLIAREALTGATLSKPRRSDPARYAKATVDPIVVRGALRYRWRYHYAMQTTDEHLAPEETARRVAHLIGGEFRQAHLRAIDSDYQVLASTKGTTVLRRAPSKPGAALVHDRRKRHVLVEGTAVPFLVELGVQTPAGKVKSQRRDK